jgi:hypothetical protein
VAQALPCVSAATISGVTDDRFLSSVIFRRQTTKTIVRPTKNYTVDQLREAKCPNSSRRLLAGVHRHSCLCWF